MSAFIVSHDTSSTHFRFFAQYFHAIPQSTSLMIDLFLGDSSIELFRKVEVFLLNLIESRCRGGSLVGHRLGGE